MPPFAIDHAVIAVRDLDAAARSFGDLGFTLTPRGFHSIGSRNHCVILGSTYVELLEPSSSHPWLAYYRDFVERGDGLAALALATADADAAYRELRAQQVAAQPPMDLARPVKIGDDERMARFRLVQVSAQVFLCQHLTPSLVWRREWQTHANGACALAAVDFPAPLGFTGAASTVRSHSPAALRFEGLRLADAVQVHGVKLAAA